jgi:hypothetical protein
MLATTVAQVGTVFLRSGLRILLTHRVDGAAVDAKLFARPCGELVQVKSTEPLVPKAKSILLAVVAVVKDKVHSPSLLVQQSEIGLDSTPVDQKHTVNINSTMGLQQFPRRVALALYLPGLKAEVSREIR